MKLLVFITFVTLLASCTIDDELSLNRSSYNGEQLRTDGYFFQRDSNYIFTIYIFYTNGTLFYSVGGGKLENTDQLEQRLKDHNFIERLRNEKTSWGLFKIDNNKIQFERWYPYFENGKPAYIRSGTILNDTTFHITKATRSDGSEEHVENEVYYFKQFSPKPDSSNTFVD